MALKCCANIYFNRPCLKQNLTPNYTKIKIPNIYPAFTVSKYKIVKLRIKDEIKFLDMKKIKHKGISSIKILCSTNFKLWIETEGNSINNCDTFKYVISVTKGHRDWPARGVRKT